MSNADRVRELSDLIASEVEADTSSVEIAHKIMRLLSAERLSEKELRKACGELDIVPPNWCAWIAGAKWVQARLLGEATCEGVSDE